MLPDLPRLRIKQDFVQLSSKHPVRIHDVGLQPDFPLHDHEFAELCLVWSGQGRHLTDEGGRRLVPGSIIVVMPGQVHAFTRTNKLCLTNIYYLSEWMLGDLRGFSDSGSVLPLFFHESIFRRPAWSAIPHFVLTEKDRHGCRTDLDEIQLELQRPQPSHFYLRAVFSRFLYRLSRSFDRSSPFLPWNIPLEIRRVLEEIENTLIQARSFSLAETARLLGYSERHTARKFRQHLGSSIGSHYQRRRIQTACRLLLDPSRSITEVAHELAFSDGAHFTRSFREEKNMSPRDYRRIFSPKEKRS